MQVGLRNPARHAHTTIESELAHPGFELRTIGALTENEQFGGDGGRQPVHGIDEKADAFAGDQVADVKNEEWACSGARLPRRRERFGEAQSVGNHADGRRHELGDLARGVGRNRRDLVGRLERPLEKLLEPGQAALDPAQLDAVPQGDESCASFAAATNRPAEQRVGHRPVHVHEVELAAPPETPGR